MPFVKGNSLGTATQFKPGNKGGGRKPDIAKRIAQRIFEDNEAEVTEALKSLLTSKKQADSRHFSALADRAYGKIPQAITGEDGGPLMVLINQIPDKDDEE